MTVARIGVRKQSFKLVQMAVQPFTKRALTDFWSSAQSVCNPLPHTVLI